MAIPNASSPAPTAAAHAQITVALVGNPNTGKSTLFGALAGVRQRVGNYPGVTVEKKLGTMLHDGQRFEIIDLPGTYSLAPRSPDEMVAVDVLLGRRGEVRPPEAILSIVDATNLERNLYLVSQVLELGLPTVVALNMVDVAAKRGIEIDVDLLQQRLGVPVVPIQAHRRVGVAELKAALASAAQDPAPTRTSPFPELFRQETADLQAELDKGRSEPLPRYLVERLLLDSGGYVETAVLGTNGHAARQHLQSARARLRDAGMPTPAIEAIARYDWVAQVLEGVVKHPSEKRVTVSDRVDRVLTHKLWGTLIFVALMLVLFTSLFNFADPLMGMVDGAIGAGASAVESVMPAGALRSLLVDGVIGGVGAVVIFLPQIMILFLFIAVLEDCGYMARAAYLMDKLMVRVGLSGKSFIPLLSSFACAVPGIMAARVIENRRDRLTTILVAPLMSCSARLPVYIILIGAFIPQRDLLGGVLGVRGLTLFAMYLVGVVTAVVVALLLKRTLLRGETPPFVMELPSYKLPSPSIVLHRMVERGWAFVRRAGTVIFAVAVIIWALAYFPRNEQQVENYLDQQRVALQAQLAELPQGDADRAAIEEDLAALADPDGREHMKAAAQQRHSFLGQMGQLVEPVVKPLGWDWRIGCAVIASFPAREVVMGVLGVIYNLGSEVDVGAEEDQSRLAAKMRQARWDETGERVYNIPVALSIMVFFALCAQCAATLAVIRRETNSWRWPVFAFVYMTSLAYVGALITYRAGMWIAG
ncbi:MAG: ferrous iron transport protein B [Pirellulales bacterium]